MTKPNIFRYHTKRQSSIFLTRTVVGGQYPLPFEIALKVTHPLEECRLRKISAYNILSSTIRDSEKSSIVMNRSRPRAFQRAIDKLDGAELSTGWVNPRAGLGWIELGRDCFIFGGLGGVVGLKRQIKNFYIHQHWWPWVWLGCRLRCVGSWVQIFTMVLVGLG